MTRGRILLRHVAQLDTWPNNIVTRGTTIHVSMPRVTGHHIILPLHVAKSWSDTCHLQPTSSCHVITSLMENRSGTTMVHFFQSQRRNWCNWNLRDDFSAKRQSQGPFWGLTREESKERRSNLNNQTQKPHVFGFTFSGRKEKWWKR